MSKRSLISRRFELIVCLCGGFKKVLLRYKVKNWWSGVTWGIGVVSGVSVAETVAWTVKNMWLNYCHEVLWAARSQLEIMTETKKRKRKKERKWSQLPNSLADICRASDVLKSLTSPLRIQLHAAATFLFRGWSKLQKLRLPQEE